MSTNGADNPNPNPNPNNLASQAAANTSLVDEILVAVGPDRVPEEIRETNGAAIKILAAENPEALFARWERLVGLLDCGNAFSQMIATHTIALLAPADREGRVGEALDRLYGHLGDAVSVAGHVVKVSPEIASAQPALKPRITAHLLRLPAVAIPNRVGLLRGYAIEAFDSYLDPAERSGEVVEFVAAGLTDDSPKTRKLAADTLKKWHVQEGK